MATAHQDSRPEFATLAELPVGVVRQLLERERRAWSERLSWEMGDAVDLGSAAIASHLMDGAALRRAGRWRGFLAIQPGRPVSRTCSGWLAAGENADAAGELVGRTLEHVPRSSRVEGQIVGFESQDAFDRGFAAHGFACEPRDYLAGEIPESCAGKAGPPGTRLRGVEQPLLSDCARVLVTAHRHGVEAAINASFRTERGAQDYLADILAGHGCGDFVPEASVTAVRSGSVIGFCLATVISPGVGHVPQIAVAPEHHGEGLGGRMLDASFRELRRLECTRVTLSVSARNERAAGWYARLGLHPVTRFTAYHRD